MTSLFPYRMKCSINGKAIAALATFCTVLVYLAVGAAIFQAINMSHENEQQKNYEEELHILLRDVEEEFHEELKAPCHMVEVLQAKPNVTNTWTFAPTVIFCLTVVTTIGAFILINDLVNDRRSGIYFVMLTA